MSSWLDKFSSAERQKIKEKYKLSEAAYEKLRQNVKGPEDLERELTRNDAIAQVKFALETEPEMKQALKSQVEHDLREQGIENVIEGEVSPETIEQLEAGQFDITVDTVSEDTPDQLVLVPEGNVNEKLVVSFSLTEKYVSTLKS